MMELFHHSSCYQSECQTIDIISEETVQELPLVQYLTEKATAEALQQGVKTRALEDILEVLELRLNPEASSNFKPLLDEIDDLQHLKQLHRAAIIADTSEDFQHYRGAVAGRLWRWTGSECLYSKF